MSATEAGLRFLLGQATVLAAAETENGASEVEFAVVIGQRPPSLKIGLFYFSDQDNPDLPDDYSFYLESARIGDQLGLDTIWTPERHFTGVGAASPNPSVLTAALAVTTKHIQLRAGSVVLPLHHPIRVVEEWAVIDRLSGGRVGLSFASGWVPEDFVLAPDDYDSRHAVMNEKLAQVRKLWAGEALEFRDGKGGLSSIRVRPRPIQPKLPIWLTATANPVTFRLAGSLGANLLTALLQLSMDQLEANIRVYREARLAGGHDPATGNVAVMMHAFINDEEDRIQSEARPALRNYFASQTALREAAAKTAGRQVNDDERVRNRILDYSVDKFIGERSLIGSRASATKMVDRLRSIGCNEIACLIDFGASMRGTFDSIAALGDLRREENVSLEDRLSAGVSKVLQRSARVKVVDSLAHSTGRTLERHR